MEDEFVVETDNEEIEMELEALHAIYWTDLKVEKLPKDGTIVLELILKPNEPFGADENWYALFVHFFFSHHSCLILLSGNQNRPLVFA